MVVTTTSITAVSVSMRSAHSTLRSPEAIQVSSGMRVSRPIPALASATHARIMAKNTRLVVAASAMRDPEAAGCNPCGSACEAWMTACSPCGDGAARGRPSDTSGPAWSSAPGAGEPPGWRARAPASEIRPAKIAPMSGRNTIAWYMVSSSTFHQIDVFDRDRPAVAEIGDQDGEPDGSLGRRHRQHQECKHLPDQVAKKGRERDQIDVHRKQDELDRHQDDDDVLAVEKDAQHAEREQDRGDGEIVPEPDDHDSPCPGRTLTIAIEVALVRPICSAMFWRLTCGLWRSVSTIAPIMATSSTRPEAWKK